MGEQRENDDTKFLDVDLRILDLVEDFQKKAGDSADIPHGYILLYLRGAYLRGKADAFREAQAIVGRSESSLVKSPQPPDSQPGLGQTFVRFLRFFSKKTRRA